VHVVGSHSCEAHHLYQNPSHTARKEIFLTKQKSSKLSLQFVELKYFKYMNFLHVVPLNNGLDLVVRLPTFQCVKKNKGNKYIIT